MDFLTIYNGFLILIICVLTATAWYRSGMLDKSQQSDKNAKIAIKIGRDGKHHYETKPQSHVPDTLFWIRLCIILIAMALLFVPVQYFIQRA